MTSTATPSKILEVRDYPVRTGFVSSNGWRGLTRREINREIEFMRSDWKARGVKVRIRKHSVTQIDHPAGVTRVVRVSISAS